MLQPESMQDRYEPIYTIGIVAKMFGISVHTLRMYEAEGLILVHKTETNRRLYSQSDVDRIACIRKMIDEKGLNLAGIKWMLAVVPCWDLLPCTEEDRKNCEAYINPSVPCWMVPHKSKKCINTDCRDCSVYRGLSSCTNFKEYLKANWRRETND